MKEPSTPMFAGVSFQTAIACLARELAMRQNVYPKQIARGKMTPEKAKREILTVQAIIAYLEAKQYDSQSKDRTGAKDSPAAD